MNSFDKVSTTAHRLKTALDDANMKASELSSKTGIDKGSISHYLSGKYEPKQIAVYKMAKALDVSEMWLWGYDTPKERPVEQKENDLLADIVDRLTNEKSFRQLIVKINSLKPEEMQLIDNLVNAISGQQ